MTNRLGINKDDLKIILSTSNFIKNYGSFLIGTIIQITDGDTVHFICNNHNDFFSDKNLINDELINDNNLNSKDLNLDEYKSGKKIIKVRLYGIDAPEVSMGRKKGQVYAVESKLELKKICLNKSVIIKILEWDRYGRALSVLYVKNNNRIIDASVYMLNVGLANLYKGRGARYNNQKELLVENELDAKYNKRGIWGLDEYVLPKDFKYMNRPARK